MKILIVNYADIQGGAAKAAYRLHNALLDAGIDSSMLVQSKSSDDYRVLAPKGTLGNFLGKAKPILEARSLKNYKGQEKLLFSPSAISLGSIIEKINRLKPDIVHFHWICGGMIKIEDIAKIKVPIVWSMHDMWPFTGGCHYDRWCGRYKEACGKCQILGSRKENDISRKVFERKRQTYQKVQNMIIVALSRWLESCAKESTLLVDKKIINLPNPIDTELFKPFDKAKARELLGLPENKRLLGFGAMNSKNTTKGFKELKNALQFAENDNLELVVFGSSEPKEVPDLGFKIHYLGRLHDDVSLKVMYSALDLIAVPSLQENLSNVIMESLACGTPVVAFDIGGNSDMVEHLQNGYLAKPFESKDLARGIDWVLNEPSEILRERARSKVLNDFESTKIAKRYIDLYKEILEN